ncbi:hypothetical protein [Mesorhizobium sp. M1272]|uniref:hypothetical protein n=1 Tax=Mesorhizobium sp. M1272 TaxID=2957074 RepID=UPI003339CD4D
MSVFEKPHWRTVLTTKDRVKALAMAKEIGDKVRVEGISRSRKMPLKLYGNNQAGVGGTFAFAANVIALAGCPVHPRPTGRVLCQRPAALPPRGSGLFLFRQARRNGLAGSTST